MNARIVKDRALHIAVIALSVIACLPLVIILADVAIKGWHNMTFGFFVEPNPTTLEAIQARQAGRAVPGGIANGIVGTLVIVLIASLIAIPLGLLGGIALAERPKSRFSAVVRFTAELLQGTPSIILGILSYMLVVVSMRQYSALAGSIALAVMMLPLIIRSTEETLSLLPASLNEAATALGASRATVVLRVLVPAAAGGILTGVLLSVSRVIGETAPLMLTALGANAVRWDPTRPMSSVSLLIWQFYNDPALSSMIWSAALFLLIIVLATNLTAKQISKKWKTQS